MRTVIAIVLSAVSLAVNAQHLRPPPDALKVYQTIELQPGATIDFADITQRPPGPLRGYVYVKFQGELVVVPVYRPYDDGTVWRAHPQAADKN